MGADDAGIEINVSWRRPRYHQRSSRRKFTARAVSQPVSQVPRTLVSSLGCIAFGELPPFLRRGHREILDEIERIKQPIIFFRGVVTDSDRVIWQLIRGL